MLSRLCGLVVILLAPAAVQAQALADKVPADAIVYAGWRGVDDLGPGYSQSNLKAVLDDSDVRKFFDQFLPELMNRIGKLNPDAANMLPILSALAKPTWEHPTAFFISGIDFNPNGPPTPHLGILWQPGKDARALKDQLQQLIGQIPLPPFPVQVVQKGDLVALMVGYDNPEAALGGGGTKALADDPAFQQALSRVMKDSVGAVYLDYQRLLDQLERVFKAANNEQLSASWSKMRDSMGLRGLKRLIVTSGFDGKDWGTLGFVEAPEPRTGILAMASGQPVGQELLSAIPQSVTMAGATRFDLGRLIETMRKMAGSMDPNAAREVNGVLDRVSRESGVDIEKDLLGSLGDQWAYFTDPTLGGTGLASITVVNRLKDPARFEQSLEKFEDYALAEIQRQAPAQPPVKISFYTTQIDGMKIHYLGIPFIAPSWVVHDGNLYVCAFPQVAAAVARHGAGNHGSILQNPGFVALHKRLGQHEPASFAFADLPKTAPNAYGSWLVITRTLGFADVFGVQSPPFMLPELSKLESHLSPAGQVSWVDKDGFHFRSVEPFPGSTLVASDPAITAVYAEPILISLMLPALNRAREQANRVKSASNLRQIGLGAVMYANNHDQKFPPDLGTIAADEDLAPSVFMNPRIDHGPAPAAPRDPKQLARWVNQHSDYVWTGAGKSVTVPADVIIAYEKPEQNAEGINLLFANGSVAFLPMQEANKLIHHEPVNGGL